MRSKFNVLLDKLNASFWFVPGLMALCSLAFLGLTARIDASVTKESLPYAPWIFSGSAEGARQLLSSLVTALITVVGIVFSVTLVSLTVASTQYGPHVLRTYMKDKADQITMGMLISNFLYALITLRMIRGEGADEFVPHISITVCLLLTLISVGFLIFFIHHMVAYIHVEKIVKKLGDEFEACAAHLFRKGDGDGGGRRERNEKPAADFIVRAPHKGFVQGIDREGLLAAAGKNNLVIALKIRPGDFVFEGEGLAALAWETPLTGKHIDEIKKGFVLGPNRTVYQDILFSVEQIVEIALRALSPSLNEPFVANLCIDYLAAGLVPLLKNPAPSGFHYSNGRLRLIEKAFESESIINGCFQQIRQNSARHPAVSAHLLGTLAKLAPYASNAGLRSVLRGHAELIRGGCFNEITLEADRGYVEEEYSKAVKALDEAAGREKLRPAA